jgi:hypothetical protein
MCPRVYDILELILEKKMNAYKVTKKIADIVLGTNGSIFGGYVRDTILHDHAARKFYRAHPKATAAQYQDESISPETKDRLIVAKDIDCCFENAGDFNRFIDAVTKKYPLVEIRKQRIVRIAYTIPAPHYRVHLKFQLSDRRLVKFIRASFPVDIPESAITVNENMTSLIPDVHMDVVISTAPPTFGKLDYECNGLILKGDTIMLSSDIPANDPVKYMLKVIDDIKDHRAVGVGFTGHRLKKMLSRKEWTICESFIERPMDTGGECLMCMCTVSKEEALKLECCAAIYHVACMNRALLEDRTGMIDKCQCFHCRVPLPTPNIPKSKINFVM